MTWPHSSRLVTSRASERCPNCGRVIGISGMGSHRRVCKGDAPAPPRADTVNRPCPCGSGIRIPRQFACCAKCEDLSPRVRELNEMLGIGGRG